MEVKEIRRKMRGFVLAFIFLAMLAAPLVSAKPTTEKNNEKFEYFYIEFDGTSTDPAEREWSSPPNGDPANVEHTRGAGWNPIAVTTVALTVGDETFTMDSDPYSVGYTCTFDGEGWLNDDGTRVRWTMRITDVIPVYDEGEEIGTIVLTIHTLVDMTDPTAPPKFFSGAITGYGTGELKGVHISGVDLGFWFVDPTDPTAGFRFGREGTITGWPEDITNPPP